MRSARNGSAALAVLTALNGVGVDGVAHAAPQGSTMRLDAGARTVRAAGAMSVAHVTRLATSRAADPQTAANRMTARLDLLVAHGERDDELAEPPDVDERLIVVESDGSIRALHAATLRQHADAMRASGVAVLARLCGDGVAADARSRLRRGLEAALAGAGADRWTIELQPSGCSLPGAVVLRPGG